MIVSDSARLIFVHIPKCAGTYMRSALAPWDTDGRFWGEKPAPGGDVVLDWAHLPLAAIERHFPETFAKFESYESFCIIREPLARFVSSFFQMTSINRSYGIRFINRDYVQIRKEFREFCAGFVQKAPAVFDELAYVHFIPQTDYIELHGRRLVRRIFAIDQIAEAQAYLKSCGVDVQLRPEAANRSTNVTPLGRKLVALAVAAKTPTVKRVWQAARRYPVVNAMRSRMLSLMTKDLDIIDFYYTPEIIAALKRIYEKDFALWTQHGAAADRPAGRAAVA